MIFDLGGGTFDVTIIEYFQKCIQVRSTLGDMHLGGQNFDSNLMAHCIRKFSETYNINLKNCNVDISMMYTLRDKCEKLKSKLTVLDKNKIQIKSFLKNKTLDVTITRDDFEEINKSLLQRIMQIVDNSLAEVKLKCTDTTDIILVGGSSRL